MRRCFPQLAVLLTLAAGTVGNARLSAAPPADRVLPKETIVYLSTASLDGLFSSLEQSHLGQLWNDPKMKPFTDHLRDHPDILWVQAEDHAGMNLGQLREVATGESAMATIRLVKGKYARIFLFDVKGKQRAAGNLIGRATKKLVQGGATASSRTVSGTTLSVLDWTTRDGQRNRTVYFLKDTMLGVAGDLAPVELVLKRWPGKIDGSLAGVRAYRKVMEHFGQPPAERGEPADAAQLRWFVDPLALIKRYYKPDPKLKGADDPAKAAKKHGFDAVLGVGGVVGFNAAGADMIQRTLIYAPGKDKTQSASSTGGESMRALKFLPGKDFDPPSWIPDSVASYKTMYIDLQNAFANCHDLYDDVYGDGIAGTLQRLLDDYRSEGGPEVDLGRQIVAHLAGRVTMIGNDVTPVHEANESDIVAFSVVKSGQSQDEVASALGRMFGGEGSGGKKIKLPGHKRFLWKTGEDSTDFPDEEGFVFHSSGVIVTRDHLFYSDDYKQMRRFLTTKAGSKPLAETAAYRRVSDRLNQFAKETPSMKTYSDYRRDWHNGYELLRLQKAKDSESMPARLMLNLLAVLTNATTDSLDIDFVKMPAFDQIKHHLGTGGMIGRDHESGWLLEGVILPPGE